MPAQAERLRHPPALNEQQRYCGTEPVGRRGLHQAASLVRRERPRSLLLHLRGRDPVNRVHRDQLVEHALLEHLAQGHPGVGHGLGSQTRRQEVGLPTRHPLGLQRAHLDMTKRRTDASDPIGVLGERGRAHPVASHGLQPPVRRLGHGGVDVEDGRLCDGQLIQLGGPPGHRLLTRTASDASGPCLTGDVVGRPPRATAIAVERALAVRGLAVHVEGPVSIDTSLADRPSRHGFESLLGGSNRGSNGPEREQPREQRSSNTVRRGRTPAQ